MIPILMYHQIAELPRKLDPLGLAVPPQKFAEQMAFLARSGYRCCTLQEAVRCLSQGRPPRKAFVLTFDDGYEDFYHAAYPVLEKHGFVAAVFLVASRMGKSSHWPEQCYDRSQALLTWEQTRELAARGIEFGSHSVTHPRLGRLDDEAAFREICDSKGMLEDGLGAPVRFFSYPYSDFTLDTEHLVESAGYEAACGGVRGWWNLFNLWRAPCLIDDTERSVAWKASGQYHRLIAFRESSTGRLLRRSLRGTRVVAHFLRRYRPGVWARTATEHAKAGHD